MIDGYYLRVKSFVLVLEGLISPDPVSPYFLGDLLGESGLGGELGDNRGEAGTSKELCGERPVFGELLSDK